MSTYALREKGLLQLKSGPLGDRVGQIVDVQSAVCCLRNVLTHQLADYDYQRGQLCLKLIRQRTGRHMAFCTLTTDTASSELLHETVHLLPAEEIQLVMIFHPNLSSTPFSWSLFVVCSEHHQAFLDQKRLVRYFGEQAVLYPAEYREDVLFTSHPGGVYSRFMQPFRQLDQPKKLPSSIVGALACSGINDFPPNIEPGDRGLLVDGVQVDL